MRRPVPVEELTQPEAPAPPPVVGSGPVNGPKYFLLIYLGQYTNLYLLPKHIVTPSQLKLLEMAEGRLIGDEEMNSGMQFVTNAIATKTEYCADGDPEDYGIWSKFRKDSLSSPGQNIDRVFVTGSVP